MSDPSLYELIEVAFPSGKQSPQNDETASVSQLNLPDGDAQMTIEIAMHADGTFSRVEPTAPKDQGIIVAVVGDRLEISIGVATLAKAAEASPANFNDRDVVRITNPALFAKHVARELEGNEDAEDLSLIAAAIDKAAHIAIEDDCPGMIWERAEMCSDEARARGCTCTWTTVHATDVDPPEPKRDRECPIHGAPYEG